MSELFPTLANREAALKYRHAEAFRKRKEGRIFPHDSIDIGTAVMVWDAEMHNKNLSPYLGPFILSYGTKQGRYFLTDPVTNIKYHREVTLDQLKVCKLATLPKEDIESYDVDFILDHRKEAGKNQYKVRFLGFNSESDEWLPAERIEPLSIRNFHNTVQKVRRTAEAEQEKVISSELKKRTSTNLDDATTVIPETESLTTTSSTQSKSISLELGKRKNPDANVRCIEKRRPTKETDIYKKTYVINPRLEKKSKL